MTMTTNKQQQQTATDLVSAAGEPSMITTANFNTNTNTNNNIDYRRLLTAFYKKHDPKKISGIDNVLLKCKGKEPKLCLMLAKKYDCSNPLNAAFMKQVSDEHDDYVSLTTLYLSIFFPQDVGEAEKLCGKHKKEDLFKKLASNFHALNPLKMSKQADEANKDKDIVKHQPIDYKELLIKFYSENNAEDKVAEVDEVLMKVKGRESILFSLLASKYETSNALNSVFEERVEDIEMIPDYLSLLKVYLSVFHPAYLPNAKSLLLKNKDNEEKLFVQLAAKFSGVNALEICGDKIGKGSLCLDSIKEMVAEETVTECDNNVVGTPQSPQRRAIRRCSVPQSPAVTP